MHSVNQKCSLLKGFKLFIFTLLMAGPSIAYGQLGIDFNQSNLPFAGISYEFKSQFRPELRIGTDMYLEGIALEGIMTYDILNKAEYEFYAGLGGRVNAFPGLVIPIGFNFYPFESKNFGFQIELAPIIGDSAILRGSWGIRYRFRKTN
jgi:hypothetical protein